MIYFIILHHKSKQKEYEKDDTVLVRSFLFIFNCICSEQSAKGRTLLFSQKLNSPNLSVQFDSDSPNSPLHKFDVLDYKIYVDIRSCFISPYPKNFNGNVTVKFRVDSTLNSIQAQCCQHFNVVTSVSMSGVSFSHSSNILTVNLNRTYNPGEIAEVKINYSHQECYRQCILCKRWFCLYRL
jgi:hypothetical protein